MLDTFNEDMILEAVRELTVNLEALKKRLKILEGGD